MSEHRKTWYEAIKANQVMQMNHDQGEKLFEALLSKKPNDGMIFYERAEAYESMDFLEAAEENYIIAQEKFPLPGWKEVAKFGVERIQQMKNYSYKEKANDQWSVFHEVHSLNKLPHEIRCESLSAIERYDVEEDACISNFRRILEQIVNDLSQKVNHNFDKSQKLKQKIVWLEKNNKAPKEAIQLMIKMNSLGSISIHHRRVDRVDQYDICLDTFYKILEYANEKIYI